MTTSDKLVVLIVDDSRADRYLLRRDLDRTGLDVTIHECLDGQEALDFLEDYVANKEKLGEKFPPHVIFLDVNMPRVDGFAFLERFSELRTRLHGLQPCVIMMFSSSEHPADRERANAHAFVKGYIVKGKTSSADLAVQVKAAL